MEANTVKGLTPDQEHKGYPFTGVELTGGLLLVEKRNAKETSIDGPGPGSISSRGITEGLSRRKKGMLKSSIMK